MTHPSSETSPRASGSPPRPTLSTVTSSSTATHPASTASMAASPFESRAHPARFEIDPNDHVDRMIGQAIVGGMIPEQAIAEHGDPRAFPLRTHLHLRY